MAPGTEVTHPGSILNGAAYKALPLDTSCAGKEKGIVEDDSKCNPESDNGQMDVVGRLTFHLPIVAKEQRCTSRVGDSTESVDFTRKDSLLFEPDCTGIGYMPILRSGSWADIGCRSAMEDEHVVIDDLMGCLGATHLGEGPGAYYGVFDGHGGREAAQFVKEKLLKFVLEDVAFPTAVEEAVRHAFLQTDMAFAEAYSRDESGTTAITVFIFGRTLLVANAGDCRAVLCRRGKAVEMSRDHKPDCVAERDRIESHGGFVDDGYLNGQLSVSRALGDWHMKNMKGIEGPLSAEPELQQMILSEEDEFFIIASDGLWDVFTSQNAMDFARRKLQQHNDPEQCSRELVAEALRRDSRDNLTVVTVCFRADPPPSLRPKFHVRSIIFAEALRSVHNLLDHNSQ